MTPLFDHVVCVVLLRPEKKMLRIHAETVVALVENAKIFGDGAHVQ